MGSRLPTVLALEFPLCQRRLKFPHFPVENSRCSVSFRQACVIFRFIADTVFPVARNGGAGCAQEQQVWLAEMQRGCGSS